MLVWWAATVVGDAGPARSLAAAAALLAAHVAAVLLGLRARREMARRPPRWPCSGRAAAALVWLAALVVWLAAPRLRGQPTPTTFWLAGLAAALVGAVVAAVVLPARSDERMSS